MFLLDTNVVSAARKRHPLIADWIRQQPQSSLFLSVITIGEISRGIEMKVRTDPVAANSLAIWLRGLRHSYISRILDVDERVAVEWGRLAAQRTRGDADGLIAATALVNDLAIVTRNTADFADTGAAVINPWND